MAYLEISCMDILCLYTFIKLLCSIGDFCCDLSCGFVPIRCFRLFDLLGTPFSFFDLLLDLLTFR